MNTTAQPAPALHDLLRQLFQDNPEALKCLDAVQRPGLSPDEKKLILSELKRAAMPGAGAGRTYMKDSFWGKFSQRMVLEWACLGNTEQQQRPAKWLSENMHRAKRPVLAVPARFMPQPVMRKN